MALRVESQPRSVTVGESVVFQLSVTVSDAEPGRISVSVAATGRCTFADDAKKKWRSRVVGGTSATFEFRQLTLACDCPEGDTLNTRLKVEGWDHTGERDSTSTRVRYRC